MSFEGKLVVSPCINRYQVEKQAIQQNMIVMFMVFVVLMKALICKLR